MAKHITQISTCTYLKCVLVDFSFNNFCLITREMQNYMLLNIKNIHIGHTYFPALISNRSGTALDVGGKSKITSVPATINPS